MKTALLGALFLIGCAGKPYDACSIITPGSNVTVHSYGDSITFGAGADHACQGYSSLFTMDIGANSDDQGISGSTLESEMPSILNNNAAPQDINTILPGFNDASIYGADPTHLQLFQTTLTEALTTLGSKGHMTLVGTTLYVTDAMLAQIPLHTNSTVDQYVNIIKSVVAQLQSQGLPIYLVDTNSIYNPNSMSYYNYHPDNYGHSVLANDFLTIYQGENK